MKQTASGTVSPQGCDLKAKQKVLPFRGKIRIEAMWSQSRDSSPPNRDVGNALWRMVLKEADVLYMVLNTMTCREQALRTFQMG